MCNGVDDDFTIGGLPLIMGDDKVEVEWNGRKVQILDQSLNILGDNIAIPSIMDRKAFEFSLPKFTEVLNARNVLDGGHYNATFWFNKVLAPPSNEFITSCHFATEGIKMPGIGAGFINGMNTSFKEALSHANYIKTRAGNSDIRLEGVYNHSNNFVTDFFEIFTLNYNGSAPNTANLLIENWTKFHEENKDNPNKKYLQFAHSMGSILVVDALKMVSPEIRQRLIVVSVGTAIVTPDELCFRAYSFASKLDIVHYGQDVHQRIVAAFEDDEQRLSVLEKLRKAKSNLILLEPHPDAHGIDHDCESPTYDKVYKHFIKVHLENNGEYR